MGKHDDNQTHQVVIDIPDSRTIELSYDQLNYDMCSDREVNLLYLRSVQTHMNHLLMVRGHLVVNDVLDTLHVPRTGVGYSIGWLYNDIHHHYVDFGPGVNAPDQDDNDAEIAVVLTHHGYILNSI